MTREMNGNQEPDVDDSGEPIGIFPTWRSIYLTIIIYTVLTVIILYVLTLVLNRSVS